MNYLDKNPPSADYQWLLADLATYSYDFTKFPEDVEVVDPSSLIPSPTAPLPPSEQGVPYIEGVEGGN